MGVLKTRTTPFHPRSDGITERANRTLLQMLCVVTQENPQEWPTKLSTVLAAYRMTTHSATGITANFAMLGRETLLPCTMIAAPPQDTTLTTSFAVQNRENLREAHSLARENLRATARTQTRYFDRQVKPLALYEGQHVWLYWPRPRIRQAQRKLTNVRTGPWVIQQFTTPITVIIRHAETRKRQVVHVDRLLPCQNQVDPPPEPTAASQPPDGPVYHTSATTPSDIASPRRTRHGSTVIPPVRYR